MSDAAVHALPGQVYTALGQEVLAAPMRGSGDGLCKGCVFRYGHGECRITDTPLTCVVNDVIFIANTAANRRKVATELVTKKLSS